MAGICTVLISACSSPRNESGILSSGAAENFRKIRHSFWGYKDFKPVDYLLITSYYELSYGLAETARRHAGVAYIMIPGTANVPKTDTELMFRGPNSDKKLLLKASDLSKFIAYLRPRNVIILGNRDYVSEQYRLAIPKDIFSCEICSPDWRQNALKLSVLTDSREVFQHYRDWSSKRQFNTNSNRNKK